MNAVDGLSLSVCGADAYYNKQENKNGRVISGGFDTGRLSP